LLTMINSDKFAQRLQKVMDYYDETASSFAERIGVQRSSISHILSGRNKPSLDFVMKVLNTYPAVELYWLMNGKGQFPKTDNTTLMESSTVKPTTEEKSIGQSKLSSTDIEKIVIFYKDGSFKSYHP
jgi:transcriptional regulator with XRE-family HTH domain